MIGADEVVSAVRTFGDQDDVRVRIDVLATDDTRQNLVRMGYSGRAPSGGGDWEAIRLVVARVEGDLIAELVLFDEDDLLGALAEMSAAGAVIGRLVEGYNARDWDAVVGLFAKDVDVRDTRPMGWGTFLGAELALARLRDRVDLAPDVQLSIDACPIVTDNAAVFRLPMHGHLADGGGEFEGGVLSVIEVEGDVIVRMQIFEPDELEAVAERFNELTS